MNNKELIAYRLRAARKMAGLSMQGLADKLKENQVTKQALSKYEQAKMMPESDVLLEIADILNVKLDYFFREVNVQFTGIDFRKKSKLPQREVDAIIEKSQDYLEKYLEVETLLNDKVAFSSPLSDFREIKSQEDIEEAAQVLRQKWHLGNLPIRNVLELLEDKGFTIAEIDDHEDFDGSASPWNGNYLIMINKKHNPLRKRFTAMHEAAHHLLRLPADLPHKDKESYCHNFAGAVLIERSILVQEVGKRRTQFTLEELKKLSLFFGVSIAALVKRMQMTGIIDRGTYTDFCISFNQYKKREYGTTKREPIEDNEYIAYQESANRFDQMVSRAIAEEIISVSKAAYLINSTVEEVKTKYLVM